MHAVFDSSKQDFTDRLAEPLTTLHWRLLLTPLEEAKEAGESPKQGGRSGLSWPLHSNDSAALCQAREAREWLHACHISLFSLVSLYTMHKERSKKACALVSASHVRVCTKVVEHCLNQLWQVVVVLPAPILPRVGVVEIHWPTVSWNRRSS